MAEMGLGYGSEYQLLRFLGHHRNELNEIIARSIDSEDVIEWFDFPYNLKRISLDGEYTGMNFMKNHRGYSEIVESWSELWPPNGSPPNWDAIAVTGETFLLVEAKAHLGEIVSSSGASDDSRLIIGKAFDQFKAKYKIQCANDWFKKYYQLANRLVCADFLHQNGVSAKLLYVYFLNGYDKKIGNPESKSVKSIDDWKVAIEAEYEYLGLCGTDAMSLINTVYVDCIS